MLCHYEQFRSIRYVIRFPGEQCPESPCPLILFLHGMGGRGDVIQGFEKNQFFRDTADLPNFPFITVAPRCNTDTWFDVFETLKAFVSDLAARSYVDASRFYLIGTSMGGYAVWQLAMSMPEVFAAIVPICGGGMYANASRLKEVPVWAFHGEKDPVVYPEESGKLVDAVNRCGGNAKLTMYPERAHDAWTDTYRNPEVFRWLLSHTLK